MPPVAKTLMPAIWAAIIVAETVVPAQPPSATRQGERGARCLARRGRSGNLLELSVGQADEQLPVVDGHRRRHASGVTHRGLGAPRGVQVERRREAVGDERRFERDDGPSLGVGGPDLGRDSKCRGHSASSGRGDVSSRDADLWPASAERRKQRRGVARRPPM